MAAGQWPAERSDASLEIPLEVSTTGEFSVPRSVAEAPLVRMGRYDLLGRIAVGGMAEIYLAREESAAGGSRDLIVKIIRPQFAGDAGFDEMFLNEGRVALGLKHPNICHVYEFGIERGHYFIAMEYVHGATLREVMRRSSGSNGERVPVALLVRVIASIAEALDAAHHGRDTMGEARGVVHGDVSPQNIMIGYDGVVKLLDFGVAQVHSDRVESGSGTIRGKMGYLSPEQCVGKPMDGRSDVFSLGVCMWEALAGKRLFKRGSEYETLRAIVQEPAPDPRDSGVELPDELVDLVLKALAKDPSERFQSAGELEGALSQFLVDRRELVNAGRVAEYMSGLFAEEIARGPRLDRSPSVVMRLGVPQPEASDASQGVEGSRPRGDAGKSPRTLAFMAVALCVLLLSGAAAWWWLRPAEGSQADATTPPPSRGEGIERQSSAQGDPVGARAAEAEPDDPAAAEEAQPETAAAAEPDEPEPPAPPEADEADEASAEEQSASDERKAKRRKRRRRRRLRTKQGFLAEPDF